MITKKSNENPHKSILEKDLIEAIALSRSNPAVFEQTRRIYHDLDEEITSINALCLAGGNCCKFDLTDHRLYLTTIELTILTSSPPIAPMRIYQQRCPYQIGPRCLAYPVRPIGCRTFYCRSDWIRQTQQLYEKYHRKIRSLHYLLGIPYFYLELSKWPIDVFCNE